MSSQSFLTDRFERALIYATQVHGGHRRKRTTIPYIAHLLGVCALVLEDGGDEDQGSAALLHDAAEDQGGLERLADIRARFGDRVADIVAACTDTYDDPKPPYVPRKRTYMQHLRNRDIGIDVLRVVAADKLNNARAILRDYRRLGDPLFDRFTDGQSGTLWYYGCMLNLLCERYPGALTDELGRVVREIYELSAGSLPWPKSEDDDPNPNDR